jgi:hypothetical protein
MSPLTDSGRALPQVRTAEPPTVARLPGYILESSSR